MPRYFERWKNLLLAIVALLFLADGAMLVYSFTTASSNLSPQQELFAQTTEIKLLKADVQRARVIQREMPKTKSDCDRFEGSLPTARAGYSAITVELGELGRVSGLQISSLDFHSAEIAARGMTEVTVDAKVTGDYKSVVKFLNGVQRSTNYYIVESLSLAPSTVTTPGTPGTVGVDLHLKSYFRGTA